jgi:N-acyl-D-aspartate/D-glutamate deacylase
MAFDLVIRGGVVVDGTRLALGHAEKRAQLRDPAVRATLRDAVENLNRDPDAGSTLPRPHWDGRFVEEVARPENERYRRRSIAEIAEERGVASADAMLDLALDEDLQTKFRWEHKPPAALAGFPDRAALLPGYAADLMLIDPETVGPSSKRLVRDVPGDEARCSARPRGFKATIANGEPIVEDRERTHALPAQWPRPHTGAIR